MSRLSGILKYYMIGCVLIAGCSKRPGPETATGIHNEETIRQINEMLQKARAISTRQPDSALAYINSCYQKSLAIRYEDGIRRSLNNIATLYLTVHPDIEGYISFFASAAESIKPADTPGNIIINLALLEWLRSKRRTGKGYDLWPEGITVSTHDAKARYAVAYYHL